MHFTFATAAILTTLITGTLSTTVEPFCSASQDCQWSLNISAGVFVCSCNTAPADGRSVIYHYHPPPPLSLSLSLSSSLPIPLLTPQLQNSQKPSPLLAAFYTGEDYKGFAYKGYGAIATCQNLPLEIAQEVMSMQINTAVTPACWIYTQENVCFQYLLFLSLSLSSCGNDMQRKYVELMRNIIITVHWRLCGCG
ncbi:hypothetical protein ACMFMG_010970 [Clarireedia jacksonii]